MEQTANNFSTEQTIANGQEFVNARFTAKWTVKLLKSKFYSSKALKRFCKIALWGSICFLIASIVTAVIAVAADSEDVAVIAAVFWAFFGLFLTPLYLINIIIAFCMIADIFRRTNMNRGLIGCVIVYCGIGVIFCFLMLFAMLLVRKQSFSEENEQRSVNNITYRIVKLEKFAWTWGLIMMIFLIVAIIAMNKGANDWKKQYDDANNYKWVRVDKYGNEIP